jgi:hypothetical protein
VGGILFLTYLFFIVRFTFQYFYRLPIENNDAFYFQDRIATRYITGLQQKYPDTKVIWVAPLKQFTFYRYIYFGGYYLGTQNIKAINKQLESQIYKIGNLTIQNSCPERYLSDSVIYIIDSALNCKIPKSSATIANINDAGAKYRLISDPLCQGYEHRRYPLIRHHYLLRVEKLSDKEFCENYILGNQE